MTQGKRDRLSTEQRIDMWRRWKAGESLHEIGRGCGKPHNCIRCVLLPRNGQPVACDSEMALYIFPQCLLESEQPPNGE